MDWLDLIRIVVPVVLNEYGTVSQHTRHDDPDWQVEILPLPQGDLYHLHSLPRWMMYGCFFSLLIWPIEIHWFHVLVAILLTATLSKIAWIVVKKAAGKEHWGEFWTKVIKRLRGEL
jgi:hypothetical protein